MTPKIFNRVLAFADQFLRCKVLDINLNWVFVFEYVYITESKFTKLKEK